MNMKPTTTDGMASSTRGTVTTQGDSCGLLMVMAMVVVVVVTMVASGFWSNRSLPWKTRKYMRNE